MTVTAPETEVRHRLIEILTTEFTSEAIEFRNDKLHDSMGQSGPIGAVYPGPATPRGQNGLILDTIVYVQLFLKWTAKVDPTQIVDPSVIEEHAERIRRRCQLDAKSSVPGDSHVWYYQVTRVEYPDDPTSNKSRLLATITAESQNPALVETSG